MSPPPERPDSGDALSVRFRELGLPLTHQRRAVLEALRLRHDHPTVDQVFADVQEGVPSIGRATVYRILETLSSAGLAARVGHPGGVMRYDPNTERHHHLLCTGCGAILDVDDAGLGELPLPRTPRGFVVEDYSIHFHGKCASCR